MDSYHIVHHHRRNKHWSVVKSGTKRAFRVYRSKLKAISEGIKLGKTKGRDVYLHRRDGTIAGKIYEAKEVK